jgi:hypothetical protein
MSKGGGDEAGRETFHTPEVGRAKDKAAEKINADVSGRSIEKGQKVKEIAQGETDKPSEVVGEESFHGAKKTIDG